MTLRARRLTAPARFTLGEPCRREATLATSLLVDFLSYLERQPCGSAAVCREAGVDRALADAPNSRVPASTMERLWAAAERLTGDPDIGMHAAESYNPGALSILGYVTLSCRTAGDVLDRLARYAPLLNDGLDVTLVRHQDLTHCRFGALDGRESFLHRTPRQVMETLAVGMVQTLARLATADVEPIAVTLRHAAPTSTAEHRRLLGATVQFSDTHNAVVYRTSSLGARIISADPALLATFEGDADQRLRQLQSEGSVSGRVLGVLWSRLKGEVPPLATIASELAMSERSVQRSLLEEATTYRQLVDEVRREMALRHLSRPGTSATDVAFLLGFSEPSAFTRAFRRWTGASPTQFRSLEAV